MWQYARRVAFFHFSFWQLEQIHNILCFVLPTSSRYADNWNSRDAFYSRGINPSIHLRGSVLTQSRWSYFSCKQLNLPKKKCNKNFPLWPIGRRPLQSWAPSLTLSEKKVSSSSIFWFRLWSSDMHRINWYYNILQLSGNCTKSTLCNDRPWKQGGNSPLHCLCQISSSLCQISSSYCAKCPLHCAKCPPTKSAMNIQGQRGEGNHFYGWWYRPTICTVYSVQATP